MIEVTDGDINDATLKNFARTLSRPNAQSEASQATLQAKIKKCKYGQQKNIGFIKDFNSIEILLILQKLHKLAM